MSCVVPQLKSETPGAIAGQSEGGHRHIETANRRELEQPAEGQQLEKAIRDEERHDHAEEPADPAAQEGRTDEVEAEHRSAKHRDRDELEGDHRIRDDVL